jgi:hypothetical protein
LTFADCADKPTPQASASTVPVISRFIPASGDR